MCENDWTAEQEYQAQEQAEEFAARPYRLFYRLQGRNFDDIGASHDFTTLLEYARDWACSGVCKYWRIVRVKDFVKLADWWEAT